MNSIRFSKQNILRWMGYLFLLFIAFQNIPDTDSTNRFLIPQITPTITPTPELTSTPVPVSRATPTPNQNLVKVIRVVDGDTIMVEIDGQSAAVRLIGVDTPETVDPRQPVQCFGREASAKTKELVEGKSVILESDPTQGDRDKYQRLLRYIRLADGTFVNQKLIADGFGFEYTYNIPYKYQAEFKESQKQAEQNKRGLWADNACPTATPVPTRKIVSTVIPPKTETYVAPVVSNNNGGSWACNCSKTCPQMSSCAEAQYQLNSCGCGARDADKDGIACDSDCQ